MNSLFRLEGRLMDINDYLDAREVFENQAHSLDIDTELGFVFDNSLNPCYYSCEE